MWVAPASRAQYALAIADETTASAPCQLHQMGQQAHPYQCHCAGEPRYHTRQHPLACAHEIIHLSWIGTAHGVCDAYTINTDLVDSLVYREQVYEVRPEGVLG